MGRWHRTVFGVTVPRAARAAVRVLTVSERSKRDVIELYGLHPDRIVVTPNGVDPVFRPGERGSRDVRALGRCNPATQEPGAGARRRPGGRSPARDRRAREGCRRGPTSCARAGPPCAATFRSSELAALYRGAACLVQASRYEGFGLPVLEAMASGTPVVTVPDAALLEVVGDAAVVVDEADLADGIRRALEDRERLVAPASSAHGPSPGVLPRNGHFVSTWRRWRGDDLRRRRLARACRGAGSLPPGARAPGRRDRRRGEPARLRRGTCRRVFV